MPIKLQKDCIQFLNEYYYLNIFFCSLITNLKANMLSFKMDFILQNQMRIQISCDEGKGLILGKG